MSKVESADFRNKKLSFTYLEEQQFFCYHHQASFQYVYIIHITFLVILKINTILNQ